VIAPAIREILLDNEADVTAFLDAILAGPLDLAVFLTGVGTQRLFDRAQAAGRYGPLLERLAGVTVAARGPKPVAVLKRAGVRVDVVAPEPNTSDDLLAALAGRDWAGKTAAVQHYGQRNAAVVAGLERMGLRVEEVSLYTWDLPPDPGPVVELVRLLEAGQIDVLAFTSASQVRNLFAIADAHDLGETLHRGLNGSVTLAAVGPVAAAAMRDFGLTVAIVPEHPKMGHMVLAIAAALEARAGAAPA
jgi:uroporphyrinogen-III synthase